MQDQQQDKSGSADDWVRDRTVEAARYALLRRLAYAMRHHMVVHLQPIGMITEVMERRLRQPSPDLVQVHESMSKINGFSRAAVQSCLDVVSWLAPEEGALIALDAGVAECVALLRSNFNFRGFTLKDEVGGVPVEVSRAGLRNVLPASMLALTDGAASPADVVISAEARSRAGRADDRAAPDRRRRRLRRRQALPAAGLARGTGAGASGRSRAGAGWPAGAR